MIPLRVDELARLVAGRVVGDADAVVSAPATADSRQAESGGLFVAVMGDHADGHDFAPDAARRGAAAALATRPVEGLPSVVVDDVVGALGRLAGAVLGRLREGPGIRVVGVTGSSGKTSTKDLLAQVLSRAGETVAPVGSYNNEIGLPLTVLRATPTTRQLVLEMSARGVGHIAALCEIAPVDVGVVLNVGTAHVGEFGSREAIAAAKSEIVAGVVEEGVTVLNADDALVSAMGARARGRVVTFGESTGADVRAVDVAVDARGRSRFGVATRAGSASVSLRLVGRHHVSNALAAVAVALESGIPLEDAAVAVSAAEPLSRWRMEVGQTADGVTVINDAYNANPESMRAALETLAHVGRSGSTWAVLGPMAELGSATDTEHAAAGRACAELGIDHVVAVGDGARLIADAASAAGVDAVRCDDADAAAALVRSRAASGDTVLVKASRSAGLERVAGVLSAARAEVAG